MAGPYGTRHDGWASREAREADALARKIRVMLANSAHLDLVATELFQVLLSERLQGREDEGIGFVHLPAAGAMSATPTLARKGALARSLTRRLTQEPVHGRGFLPAAENDAYVDFETGLGLVYRLLETLRLPFADDAVAAYVASACGLFALSRAEADIVTEERFRFAVDCVLRCLAERALRGSPAYYERPFLVGFGGSTKLASSGLRLTGAVAHGLYGDVWLSAEEGEPMSRRVVCSVSKALCLLPPELLSDRLRDLADMERLPHVLPLLGAYEDFEHVHLVYEGLSATAVCLTDKVLAEMQAAGGQGLGGFCERSAQQIVWRVMSALKEAHLKGYVHGSIRLDCCYLDDPETPDSLRILEFGLWDLFAPSEAKPPMAVLNPPELDRTVPEPQYRRDCLCLAELTYLLLGGQPLCPPADGADAAATLFARGVASFVDEVYAKTSEGAKAFVLELLRPAGFRRQRAPPFQEVPVLMTHRWFCPTAEALDALGESCDAAAARNLESWRNTRRMRAAFLQLAADYLSLRTIARLERDLADLARGSDRVSWAQLRLSIDALTQIGSLLQRVSRAFGEDEQRAAIHVAETCEAMRAWRRRRVRQVLWQPFARAGACGGALPSAACAEGLASPVDQVWSRPCRVLDVVLPPPQRRPEGGGAGDDSEDAAPASEPGALIGAGSRTVTYLELVARSDAAGAP